MAQGNDPIWADLQKKLLVAMKNTDLGEMAQIYYQQATFVRKEGKKDGKYLVAEGVKCELSRMEVAAIKHVRIISSRDKFVCYSCDELNNKIYSIKEAQTSMPVPNLHCTSDIQGVGKNWCRCTIVAVIPT
jgi:hypothetical protein